MIAVVGYANLDVVAQIEEIPLGGERAHATSIERHAGGMGVNAAVAAARMGGDVAFMGALGDDEAGALVRTALESSGVDTTNARVGQRTTTCLVLVDRDGERAIISEDDDLDIADVGRAIEALAKGGSGWLYLDGYRLPWACALLRSRPQNVSVVVDIDGLESSEALAEAAGAVDHIIASAKHLGVLTGSDPQQTAADLTEMGATVVITQGGEGWQLFEADAPATGGNAFPVATIDTTGAGDAFCGAYLAALDAGHLPAEAAALASAAAALATTGTGSGGHRIDRRSAEALVSARRRHAAWKGASP